MVLQAKKDIDISKTKILRNSTLKNGKWTFDSDGFFKNKYKYSKHEPHSPKTQKFWNDQFEEVLNGPSLADCNRCGIPDTIENLERGVEHSRIQCEEASFYFRIYKKLSDECRENPGKNKKCLEELKEARKSTKFQDWDLYSSNYVLRNYPCEWSREFEVPYYEGDNKVSKEWEYKYHDAVAKLNNPAPKKSLQGVTEGFAAMEMKTRKMMERISTSNP